jgi:hypothetical protein
MSRARQRDDKVSRDGKLNEEIPTTEPLYKSIDVAAGIVDGWGNDENRL